MKKSWRFFLLVSIVVLHADLLYAGMSSPHYQIPTSVFSSGGDAISSSNYDMNGTIGQPTPLEPNPPAQSPVYYDLYPGFWYTLDAALYGCLWDIEPEPGDGDVDGSDLAGFADSFDEADLPAFASEFGRDDCL